MNNGYEIVVFHPKTPVRIEPMYVCGNLHSTVYMIFEKYQDWPNSDVGWFFSIEAAIVWAIAHGRTIMNWQWCEMTLEEIAECRRQWESVSMDELEKMFGLKLRP